MPFYRLKITERTRSAQHDLLLTLDNGINEVFYAAPQFHTVEELNSAYLSSQVSNRSFYIRPRDIGPLDYDAHHVAFDAHRFFVCSEPREIQAIRGNGILEVLQNWLSSDKRALDDGPLDEILQSMYRALSENLIRVGRPDSARDVKMDGKRKLKEITVLSLRFFGAQFFVIQNISKS